MAVIDYCEGPARSVAPEETVREAARRMDEENVGCLVVTVDGEPQNVVTDRDLALEVLCNNLDPSAVSVGEIARGLVVTVPFDASLAEAARLMARHAVRRLPVVDDKNHLVGVIAADDVVRVVVGELSGLASAVEVQAVWRREPEEGGE